MRHNNQGRKLGRSTPHRLAMLGNMVASLIEHERITTTVPKAKEARRLAEKVITLGKKNTLHARRQAFKVLKNETLVKKVFDELRPRFEHRPGGYTRILKLGFRHGDNADMGLLELVEKSGKAEAPAEGEKKAEKAGAEAKAEEKTEESA